MLRATDCGRARRVSSSVCHGFAFAWKTHVDETGVDTPPVNDTPLDVVLCGGFLALRSSLSDLPVQLVQAAAGGRARVLRVLGEGDRALDAVPLHLFEARLGLGVGVPERDVGLVRCSFGRQLVEQFSHAFALDPRPLEDRRTASDGRVLLFDFGRPALGDQRREDRLERQRNELPGVVSVSLDWSLVARVVSART